MPQLRVFVSSTVRDLSQDRDRVRDMVISLGHHAVLSEYSGILYDPTQHTEEACVQELLSCDVVVLLVGGRLGSTATPKFVDRLDLGKLEQSAQSDANTPNLEGLSVTQLEAMSAFERSIPVFVFVSSEVQADRKFLDRNRHIELKGGQEMHFSSGVSMSDLEYISKFLAYIEKRASNNAVIEYRKVEDILEHLKIQWSSLLQRMLRDRQETQAYRDLMDALTAGIQEIKSGIVALSPDEKKTLASQVMQYRNLCVFISFFTNASTVAAQPEAIENFKAALKAMGLVEVIHTPASQNSSSSGTYNVPEKLYLVRSDDHLATEVVERTFERLERLWSEFSKLDSDARESIYQAVSKHEERFDWGDKSVDEINNWDNRMDVDKWISTDGIWGEVGGMWNPFPDVPPF